MNAGNHRLPPHTHVLTMTHVLPVNPPIPLLWQKPVRNRAAAAVVRNPARKRRKTERGENCCQLPMLMMEENVSTITVAEETRRIKSIIR